MVIDVQKRDDLIGVMYGYIDGPQYNLQKYSTMLLALFKMIRLN